MEKFFLKHVSAGNIKKELEEIEKLQGDIPYILTISTNTCEGITSVICC